MTTNLDFYRKQATREQAQANDAVLANVRARSQSAADAWTALADRHQRLEENRAARALTEQMPGQAIEEPSENPDRDKSATRPASPNEIAPPLA